MIHVIDAGPMIALLNKEQGFSVIEQVLLDNPGECYAHFMNMCEVYYIFYRRGGQTGAETALQKLEAAGIQIRGDADTDVWKEAARFKAMHPMSLPDGYCIALARRLGGTVVTTDHNEFDPLVPLHYAPILFIR